MKRISTTFIVACLFYIANAQSAAQWTWGHANTAAPITINPEVVHQALAAHENKALWCNIINNQFLGNDQYGDYSFTEYDTIGNALSSTMVTGKLLVLNAEADQSGNWYILARYEDTIRFASGTSLIKGPMSSDVCLFRLHASSLALDWVSAVGEDLFCSSSCFTIAANAIYLPIDSADGSRICKIDLVSGNRTTLWEQGGGSWTTSIKTDSKNNIYLAGTCASNLMDFNGHQVSIPTNLNYLQFIVRYKADGTYDWSRFMPDVTCFTREFNIADDNTIYYSGPVNDTLSLGNIHLHGPNNFFSFMVAQLDSTGSFNWARQLSDTASGEAHLTNQKHAVTGPDNSIRVYTATSRYNDWGNGVTTYTTPGQYSGTIISYDKSGNAQWARDIKGNYLIPQQMAGSGNSVWCTGNIFDSTAIYLDQVTVPLPGGSFAYYPWVARLRLDNITTSLQVTTANSRLTLVPNPAHDQFLIKGPLAASNKIGVRIINSMGQEQKRTSVHGNEAISLMGFTPGLYFVELSTGNSITVEKLMVQ